MKKGKLIKQLVFLLLVLVLTLSLAACAKTTIEITNGDTVKANAELTLTAVVKDGKKVVENPEITWTVADQSGSTTGATITGGKLKATSEGKCIVTAKYNKVEATKVITITKADDPVVTPTVTSVTVAGSATLTYGGGTSTYTATVTGTNSPAQTVTWSVTPASVATINSSTGVLTIVSAGEATVKATSTVDTTKSGTRVVTINKATATITAENKTVSYNGAAQTLAGVTVSNGLTPVITYYSNSDRTTVVPAADVKNAGTYYVRVTIADNANYTAAAKDVTLTIEKANQTLSATLVATVLSDTSISATAITGAEYTVNDGTTWQDSNVFTGLTANTAYIVKARLKADGNHNASAAVAAASVTTTNFVATAAAFDAKVLDFLADVNKAFDSYSDFVAAYDILVAEYNGLGGAQAFIDENAYFVAVLAAKVAKVGDIASGLIDEDDIVGYIESLLDKYIDLDEIESKIDEFLNETWTKDELKAELKDLIQEAKDYINDLDFDAEIESFKKYLEDIIESMEDDENYDELLAAYNDLVDYIEANWEVSYLKTAVEMLIDIYDICVELVNDQEIIDYFNSLFEDNDSDIGDVENKIDELWEEFLDKLVAGTWSSAKELKEAIKDDLKNYFDNTDFDEVAADIIAFLEGVADDLDGNANIDALIDAYNSLVEHLTQYWDIDLTVQK